MKFRTELKKTEIPFDINHKHQLLLMGSCFSDNIAEKLNYYKFNTLNNPFGILYNPISINKLINDVVAHNYPEKSSFIKKNELWHHFDYHSNMSGVYLNEVSKRINILIDATGEYLQTCDYIFITYGTAIVHKRIDTGEIVANNHKFPSDYFVKSRLSIEEITKSAKETLNNIKSINPNAKIIFTISPVRHIKEGMIENQRSKAVLHLAIEKLVDKFSTFYFPSYELLLDDLRDYRYYSYDLVHPSDSALEYIWEKFSNTFFNNSTLLKIVEIEKILKSIYHKPFNKNTKSYLDFVSKLNQKIKEFKLHNPHISFEPVQ